MSRPIRHLVTSAIVLAFVAASGHVAFAQARHPGNTAYPDDAVLNWPMPQSKVAVLPFTLLSAPTERATHYVIGIDELVRYYLGCDFRFAAVPTDAIKRASVVLPARGGIGVNEAALIAARTGARYSVIGVVRLSPAHVTVTGWWYEGNERLDEFRVQADRADALSPLAEFAKELAFARPYAQGQGPSDAENDLRAVPFASSNTGFDEFARVRVAFWRGEYVASLAKLRVALEQDASLATALLARKEAVHQLIAFAPRDRLVAELRRAAVLKDELETAVTAHPQDYRLKVALATLLDLYARRGTEAEVVTGPQAQAFRRRALSLSGDALGIRPNSIAAHVTLCVGAGLQAIQVEHPDDWDEALDWRRRVAARVLGPNLSESYQIVGTSLLTIGRKRADRGANERKLGLRQLKDGMRRFPNDSNLAQQYGGNLMAPDTEGDAADAWETFEAHIATHPDNAALRFYGFVSLKESAGPAPTDAEHALMMRHALAFMALTKDRRDAVAPPLIVNFLSCSPTQQLNRLDEWRQRAELHPEDADAQLIAWGLIAWHFLEETGMRAIAEQFAHGYADLGGAGISPLVFVDPWRDPNRRFTPEAD